MIYHFESLIAYARATWKDHGLLRFRMPLEDAAELLGVTKPRVTQMVDEAKLEAVRIEVGASYRLSYLDPREVKALVSARGDKA